MNIQGHYEITDRSRFITVLINQCTLRKINKVRKEETSTIINNTCLFFFHLEITE